VAVGTIAQVALFKSKQPCPLPVIFGHSKRLNSDAMVKKKEFVRTKIEI